MRLNELVELDEIFGGERGYRGEGNGFFAPRFYMYIASQLQKLNDVAARKYLIDWFVGLFKSDNPKFKEQVFRQTADGPSLYSSSGPKFEQRHFYYLAHHINAIADLHIREFVTNWLGDVIGDTNEDFMPMRWRKFCGLPMTKEQEKDTERPRDQSWRNRRY